MQVAVLRYDTSMGDAVELVTRPEGLLARLLGYQPPGNTIHVIEALYLLYTGHAVLEGSSSPEHGFRSLVEAYSSLNPYAWVLFEVYYDLRKRGRLPAPGPRPHSLLVRRSKKDPRYTKYVLVLEESRRLDVSSLVSFAEEALRNRWEPIVAIVDRYGDITYYSITLFRPRSLAAAEAREAASPQPGRRTGRG